MTSESQVIIYNPDVNLTERKSALNNNIQEVVTVSELKGYKVYTALLTQSGEKGESYLYGPSDLTIGVTYTINLDPNIDCDFTNVGAPNNNIGTSFVATGTTPNSWGSDPENTELMYFTGAPVVTVLENTIGNIWFTFNSTGIYIINSEEKFIDNKTVIISSPKGYIESPTNVFSFDVVWTQINNTQIYITSHYNNEPANDVINYGGAAMIEIRVYN